MHNSRQVARKKKYKRPTREQLKAMTPEERLEHKRALDRERQQRMWKRRMESSTVAERRAARKEAVTRAFTWKRLLPYIERQESGCWLWTGAFKLANGVLRPWVQAGAFGGVRADYVVCCLHRGRPPPYCFVASTCATLGCIAPEHTVWSNQAVETAKRRRAHEQGEELARRVE